MINRKQSQVIIILKVNDKKRQIKGKNTQKKSEKREENDFFFLAC